MLVVVPDIVEEGEMFALGYVGDWLEPDVAEGGAVLGDRSALDEDPPAFACPLVAAWWACGRARETRTRA